MKRDNIILIGGGGHCKSVIDVVESGTAFTIVGILDPSLETNSSVLGYKVLGSDELISHYQQQGCYFVITVGHIQTASVRQKIAAKLQSFNANLATIISAKASVSKHAKIGKGTVVFHNSVINAGATIGEHSIINTGAIVEHDTNIDSFVHVSTAAVINGECKISTGCFVGSNAVLFNNILIEENTKVGAGSVLTQSVLSKGTTVIGNPAKTKK